MTLDLNLLAGQVAAIADTVAQDHMDWKGRLDKALEVLGAADAAALAQKIASSKTTWLPAGLVEGLCAAYPPPPCPSDFTVIATDGSHIDVDRHRPLRCSLVNIGEVTLHYGANPWARLRSRPTLYSRREELEMSSAEGTQRPREMEGALLGAKRTIMEVEALAALGQETEGPAMGLLDGTLILWSLGGKETPDFVRKALLEEGLLSSLDAMRERSKSSPLAVASYISFPRATDVVDALRIAACPDPRVDCDRACSGKRFSERACDAVAGVVDRDIFAQSLKPGERSPVFASRSHVMKHYREHEVCFFYVRAEEEVARLELPRWVAENRTLLDMTHAIAVNQCRRGQGYPVALSEAHERAVITGPEREHFWHMVDRILTQGRLSTSTSLKSQSKRTRWV
ncbi:MAG: DNA double-strand break repair nuclease NurA [Chloroflexi bacterium]|nr:DNA double-strand break repair nuclease NurA [Chloroflexota bacterium]